MNLEPRALCSHPMLSGPVFKSYGLFSHEVLSGIGLDVLFSSIDWAFPGLENHEEHHPPKTDRPGETPPTSFPETP